MRTSFHHQPEAQHPIFQLSTSWQADYPIFRGDCVAKLFAAPRKSNYLRCCAPMLVLESILPNLVAKIVLQQSGAKRTSAGGASMSAYDPSETLAVHCANCFGPHQSTCFSGCNAVV